MRVLAAMSGGVDSAVAAARVAAAGHEVTGVHFALSADPQTVREGARGCCTLSDARDARRAADAIGIPFYVWDLAERFREDVIEDFLSEYAAGRTPNPCVRCNERVKFAAVLERALAMGFDAVCTGHYAQISHTDAGLPQLRRAVDADKDQSYVLAVVAPDRLAHVLLPLGDTTKPQVRLEAAERGLQVARKPDSYDICFIPDGDTRGFVARKLGAQPGPIVDANTGTQVGEHAGALGYTIGQRKGLGLSRPATDGKPRYVVGVDPAANTVFVGNPSMLRVDVMTGESPILMDDGWPSSMLPETHSGWREDLLVQVRAHGTPVAARARLHWLDGSPNAIEVQLSQPLRAVAAGQTLVLYRGDLVVASATIAVTSRMPQPVQ